MSDYTPTTEEVRGDYANFQLPAEGGDLRAEYAEALSEFDRWFASEIEKAERRGEVLATARRIASENAELMRRLS